MKASMFRHLLLFACGCLLLSLLVWREAKRPVIVEPDDPSTVERDTADTNCWHLRGGPAADGQAFATERPGGARS